MASLKRIIIITLLSTLILGLYSCGGGGGGGGDTSRGNPADVAIEISPRSIDSGDRVNVLIRLRDIQVDDFVGLVVKVLHPAGLQYSPETGTLLTDGTIDSNFSPTEAQADEASYLLFFLDLTTINPDNRSADIEFLMRGTGSVVDGIVAVDVDNANQDNRDRFDVTNPLFTSLTSANIDVIS